MLFGPLIDNRSHLLFSTDLDPNVRYELHQQMALPAPPVGGVWATPAQIDVMNPPIDVDGLETISTVPEPGTLALGSLAIVVIAGSRRTRVSKRFFPKAALDT